MTDVKIVDKLPEGWHIVWIDGEIHAPVYSDGNGNLSSPCNMPTENVILIGQTIKSLVAAKNKLGEVLRFLDECHEANPLPDTWSTYLQQLHGWCEVNLKIWKWDNRRNIQ